MAWCVAGVPILSEGELWPGVLLLSEGELWPGVFLLSEGEPWPGVLLFLMKESLGLVCCWGPYS